MTTEELLQIRLTNQQLARHDFQTPAEVVYWLGAVQSQDYAGAKWALAQRLPSTTDALIEEAFNRGEILRTHVMRPTWHFVHPSDIRFLLALTAPRVKKLMSSYNKVLELTDEVFAKGQKIITQYLKEEKEATRQELKDVLTKEGIKTDVQRLAHIVMQAELDGLIVSGPRRGKQFTYTLLENRVPKTKTLTHEEALAEITKRYFTSHGPATIKDFVWWSGLTVSDAKQGIEMNKSRIVLEIVGEKEYWFYPASPAPMPKEMFMLPNYDEYGIAYTEREAFFSPEYKKLLDSRGNATFQNLLVYKGHMVGTWKRTIKKNSVIIEYKFFTQPATRELELLKEKGERFGKFLNVPARISPF